MAFSPAASPTDLTREDFQSLEQQNLVQRSTTILGKRTVSGAFLSPPSSNVSNVGSVSSSSSSASVRTRNFTGALRSFDIPAAAESAEALEFIGFTSQAANEIFQRYLSRPDPNTCPDSLLDYAYGHASMLKLTRFSDLTPQEALTRVGLTTKQRDALLDPVFSHILWTESLYFWVRDTLRTNYSALLRLQQRMKNQARGGGRKAKRASLQGAFPGPGPATGTAPVVRQPEVTASVNMTSEDFHLPASQIALGSEGPLLPDHLVLYKGRAASDMYQAEWIRADGSINMLAMASYAGGDFNPVNVAWYWTPEKDVAEQYRAWAERRCPFSETWLIRIQIPNSFVNSLTKAELWYGRDWKEYVWHCKKLDMPPAKYDYLWQHGRADIVRGHICTGVNAQIARIKQEEVQTRITEEHAMMSSSTNRKAIQYTFMQIDSATRMGELIRGKIHIDISGAAQNRQSS